MDLVVRTLPCQGIAMSQELVCTPGCQRLQKHSCLAKRCSGALFEYKNAAFLGSTPLVPHAVYRQNCNYCANLAWSGTSIVTYQKRTQEVPLILGCITVNCRSPVLAQAATSVIMQTLLGLQSTVYNLSLDNSVFTLVRCKMEVRNCGGHVQANNSVRPL
jgi:hypothetical protein